MATGSLDPLVAGLVDVMTNPSLVVTTEVRLSSADTKSSPRLSTFWRSGPRAVIGQTDSRRRLR